VIALLTGDVSNLLNNTANLTLPGPAGAKQSKIKAPATPATARQSKQCPQQQPNKVKPNPQQDLEKVPLTPPATAGDLTLWHCSTFWGIVY